MNRFTKLASTAVLAISALAATQAFSNPTTGPVYPPPGGVTFAASGGSAGDPGGRTFNYSAFDNSFFSELYWGEWSTALAAATLDGTLHPMTFDQVNPGNATEAWWQTTTSWFNPTTLITSTETIRLAIQIAGLGLTPWVSAVSLGLPSTLGVVADDSAGLNYSANLRFYVPTESNLALNQLQQALNCSPAPCTRSSFNGGFYYADALPDNGVPEPGTLALLGLGILGASVVRKPAQRRAGESGKVLPSAPCAI